MIYRAWEAHWEIVEKEQIQQFFLVRVIYANDHCSNRTYYTQFNIMLTNHSRSAIAIQRFFSIQCMMLEKRAGNP